MPLDDILALEASLLNLAITCYPEQLDYVDEVFKFCGEVLEEKKYVFIHSSNHLSNSSSMQLLYLFDITYCLFVCSFMLMSFFVSLSYQG